MVIQLLISMINMIIAHTPKPVFLTNGIGDFAKENGYLKKSVYFTFFNRIYKVTNRENLNWK